MRCGLGAEQSAALRVLLATEKKLAAAGGKLVLSSLQPHVLEVFSLSGFGQLFQIAEGSTVAVHKMTTETYEDGRKTSTPWMSFYTLEDGKIIKAVHVVDRLHRRFP